MFKRSSSKPSDDGNAASNEPRAPWKRIAGWGAIAVGSGALVVLVAAIVAVVAIYPKLPDVSELSDYRPKLPLRVYSTEGQLIGEFGEERRNLTPFANIPKVMKDAVLAVEDARFYDHGGVDYKGFLRAAVASLKGGRKQGASTITMQVARNVYLSSERTMSRKTYEILLALRLERQLHQGPDPRDLPEPDLPGQPRLRLCGRRRNLFRQAAAERHRRRSRDAGRPAESARCQQPRGQPAPRAGAPALRDRPDAGNRLHHRRPGCRSQEGRTAPARRRRSEPPACRVRGRRRCAR